MIVIALSQPEVITESTYECPPGMFQTCGNVTTTRINYPRVVLMSLGNFGFVAGIGAWLGTYDAEKRAAQSEE